MNMMKKMIEQARIQFDNDFSKEGYMEKRTEDQQHRMMLMKQLSFNHHDRVLDLGMGNGFLVFPLAKACPHI